MNLTEFLMDNPVDDVTEEIKINLKRKDTSFDATFVISAVTGEQFNEYQKLTNKIQRHGKPSFDQKRFNELVVVNHTVTPNFKDAESIEKIGCATPEQFLYKSLLAGEIAELSERIMTLSGFDHGIDELKDDVKNS